MGTVEYSNEKIPLWSESSVPRKVHMSYAWLPPDELWGSEWIWELWPNQCIIHWWIHNMMAFTGKRLLAGGSEELDCDSDLSVSLCFLAIIRQPVCSRSHRDILFPRGWETEDPANSGLNSHHEPNYIFQVVFSFSYFVTVIKIARDSQYHLPSRECQLKPQYSHLKGWNFKLTRPLLVRAWSNQSAIFF